MPSTAKRYEMPSEGTSAISSRNWKPARSRSYAQQIHSDATSDTVAPANEINRTSIGRRWAKNMMRSALTNGAQVMTERIGIPVTPAPTAPRAGES